MCWGHTQWLHCFNGLCNHFQRGFPILCQQRRNFGTTSVLHCLIPQTSNPSEETCERFDSFSRAFLPPLSLCLRTHMQHSSCLHAWFFVCFGFVLFYFVFYLISFNGNKVNHLTCLSLGLCVTETKRGWDVKIVFCIVLCFLPMFLLKRAHEF